jgi:UDPglucose 6-dehydrogenase
MKIAVVGTGYVGLVAGTCFADMGHDVICVDIDEEKIRMLEKGKVPIYEPGLDTLIKKNVKAGRLAFTTHLDDAVEKSAAIFIAVGTPPKPNGDADLSYIENVARGIAAAAKKPKIVVEKSTVPVQTCERIIQVLDCNDGDGNGKCIKHIVVSNPEFLREGSAVKDFLEPDRVVIGTDSEEARRAMKEIYAPLKAKMLFTDIKSAEIIKHASNSFLATKISFINAVASVCEKTGADIEMVAEGMGLDSRIGPSFLNAGIGYGGFCFPKDVEAFIRISEKNGYDFKLLKEVQAVNKSQKELFVQKVENALWNLNGKTIGVLGLAFKPNTDDMRFAPSIDIIQALLKEGAKVRAFDPEAMERAKGILGKDIEYCEDMYAVADGADALLFLTEWDCFKKIDLAKVKKLLKQPFVFDGRNMFSPKEMRALGFKYESIGRL